MYRTNADRDDVDLSIVAFFFSPLPSVFVLCIPSRVHVGGPFDVNQPIFLSELQRRVRPGW